MKSKIYIKIFLEKFCGTDKMRIFAASKFVFIENK